MSKSGKPPAFQFYVKEWISSKAVRMMNPTQRGYYIQLLAEAWDNVPIAHLPNEKEVLQSLAGEPDDETWENNHRLVLDQFKVRGKLIYNKRLLEERKKQEVNKANGRKGGTTSAKNRKDKHLGVNPTPTKGQAKPDIAIAIASSTAIATATAEEELKPSARKARSAKAKPVADGALPQDSKHSRIQTMIMNAWSGQNGGQQCPWDGGEAKQLKDLLAATPQWPDTNYAQCLDHMYRSEGFPSGTRPREFLPRLPRYFRKPLDRFKNEAGLQANGNGNRPSRETTRIKQNREAIVSGLTGSSSGEPVGYREPELPKR